MTNKQDFSKEVLAGYLDHAVLDPSFTRTQLKDNIMIGVDYGCKSVCVNPDAIELLRIVFKDHIRYLCRYVISFWIKSYTIKVSASTSDY